MDFVGWLDDLLGGGSSGGASGGQNLGGISGAWSFGLSQYFARAPGPLAPLLTMYFTSGINFDDPSDLAEAMSMLDQAGSQPSTSDDGPGGRRTTTPGSLQQVAASGESAVDDVSGHASRTIGQLDEAADTYRGPGPRFDYGDPDPLGGRRLETFDRSGSGPAPDTGTAERTLLGSPADTPPQSADSNGALRTRPENAQAPRPESDSPALVPIEVSYTRDPAGTPIIVVIVGTVPPSNQAPAPPGSSGEVYIRGSRPSQAADDAIPEVFVRGTRPPRPPQAPTPRPENSPDSKDDRDFWSRGGAGLMLGATTAVFGTVIILSNPVGWVVGLTGALMLASGTAASLGSFVELNASYAGKTMPEQDAAMNRATSAVLATGSPGGIAGGVAGAVYSGDSQGFEQGAFAGGLAEGAVSLGAGLGQMGAREVLFGRPGNMRWDRTAGGEIAARTRNQQVYRLGDVAARSRPNPMFPGSVERIELSHFLPQRPTDPASLPARARRVIGPSRYERIVNRPFNVTPLWGGEHALVDPARYQFTKKQFKLLNPQLTGPARWSRFTPPWLVRSAYGGMRSGLTLGDGLLAEDAEADTADVYEFVASPD
jgi:hypothetical protein